MKLADDHRARIAWTAAALACLSACGGGNGSMTPAQAAAQDLCAAACSCSSDSTVAAMLPSGQPKEPQHFGTKSACESFYTTFLTPADGGYAMDPSTCSAQIAGATCASDTMGGHYFVPPDACRISNPVGVADGG